MTPIEIERWDEREDGDEDSEVVLRGPSLAPTWQGEGGGFAVRVRDCHEHWRPLQNVVPDDLLTDELYRRMCEAVGLPVEIRGESE